ncbi:bifunctional diguanylate cyclase/phosphodiesterase [Azospirillum sp. TSO22-1]|uniref:putative bifunctional diguanylate cyclase/phosphodiesterase n=1 Tax=Azospirillum sp. TSO22-1 TaxID=716789 RepID=UPI000D6512B2|nr:bifunctional diguanylate cyclase/phosphodiesterase [Azospirillum sp. TSO22-1]
MAGVSDKPPDSPRPLSAPRRSSATFGELEQMRRLLDTAEMRVALVGPDRRYRYANRAYCDFVGITPDAIVGMAAPEVLGERLYRELRSAVEAALAGNTSQVEQWVDYPLRGRRFVRRVHTPNVMPDGRLDGYAVFVHDITEHHRAEDELRASEALKAAVVNGALDGVVAIDGEHRIVEFNPAAERIFGRRRADVLGLDVADILIPPELVAAHQAGLRRYLETGERRVLGHRFEVEAMRSDGWRIPVELTVSETSASGGRLFVASIRDISDRKRMERELMDLAYRDQETGLANRQGMLRTLADTLAAGRPATLLCIDLDRFSKLRHSFGHEFAHAMLAGLAARLMGSFIGKARLARVTDDALGLLLEGAPDDATLAAHVESIAALLRRTRGIAGGPVHLTASIGAVAVGGPDHTPEDLLRDAEIAAFHARELGGARWVRFEPGLRDRLVSQTRVEHDLREALEQHTGLWLAYQPIVDLCGCRLRGFEALLRWTHPELGNVPPAEFIPVAESTGLIVALGRWVLAEACRQLTAWTALDHGSDAPPFMSVNLSPVQLGEAGFVDEVARVLEETGADAKLLKLEITEGAVIAHGERSLEALDALKRMGVRLAIDDFGTGYSSLSYLTRLPVDSLKVDRSFLQDLQHSTQGDAILRAIIDVAHTCGFDVVAEGVETAAVAEHLKALSCDYAQGYYFARPLTPEAADAMVRNRSGVVA